jgi:hypothetical protein
MALLGEGGLLVYELYVPLTLAATPAVQVFGAKYEPVEVLFVDAAYHVVRLVGLVIHDKHAYAHGQKWT